MMVVTSRIVMIVMIPTGVYYFFLKQTDDYTMVFWTLGYPDLFFQF